MGFEGAAFGEGLGEEIEDERAVADLVLQMELERLAGKGAAGGEIRREGAFLQRSRRGGGKKSERGGGECEGVTHQWILPGAAGEA